MLESWWSPLADAAGTRRRFTGKSPSASEDRVFLPFGNRLEFFAELLAIWKLGACAIPIDARLTAFEVENLARAATPKIAVVDEATHVDVLAMLNKADVRTVVTTDTGSVEAVASRIKLELADSPASLLPP